MVLVAFHDLIGINFLGSLCPKLDGFIFGFIDLFPNIFLIHRERSVALEAFNHFE